MMQHFIIDITRWGYMGCSQQLVNLLTDFVNILWLNKFDTLQWSYKKVLKGKDLVYMTEMYQYAHRAHQE